MATIIKQGAQPGLSGEKAVRGMVLNLEDMSNHGDRYVESVRREAAKVVQEAHTEASEIRARAEEAGRQAAEKAIERLLDKRVATQMSTLKPALQSLVDQIAESRGAWLDHWQEAAVGLAISIAEQLVRRELKSHPELSVEWIRDSLELAVGAAEVRVRLNPVDKDNLGLQVEGIAESVGQLASTRVDADDSISAGGCVVETRYGRIDMQVEAQLERIRQELSD